MKKHETKNKTNEQGQQFNLEYLNLKQSKILKNWNEFDDPKKIIPTDLVRHQNTLIAI